MRAPSVTWVWTGLLVLGLTMASGCAEEPPPAPALHPVATVVARDAAADRVEPTVAAAEAGAPTKRVPVVVREPPVPAGWVSVASFSGTAFSKPATFFRHDGGPRSCVPWRFDGRRITVTMDDAFGVGGLNLDEMGEGPRLGPLKMFIRYVVVLESGTFARGPYSFRIDEVESGYIDAKGRRVHPPGRGEGWSGDSAPTFTVVAEEATALVVIDDERSPFIAYDPHAVERWFTTEAACKARLGE
jgi:hypothetical protein